MKTLASGRSSSRLTKLLRKRWLRLISMRRRFCFRRSSLGIRWCGSGAMGVPFQRNPALLSSLVAQLAQWVPLASHPSQFMVLYPGWRFTPSIIPYRLCRVHPSPPQRTAPVTEMASSLRFPSERQRRKPGSDLPARLLPGFYSIVHISLPKPIAAAPGS
jgi:hypothetical protein